MWPWTHQPISPGCFLITSLVLESRGGQNSNQIKSTQKQFVFKSNQIIEWESSNQIKSDLIWFDDSHSMIWFAHSPYDLTNHKAKNEMKSNHDLICISNQNFGHYQNKATARAKSRFHRQIWHRSKALGQPFLSVALFSPELKNASIMIFKFVIKSNQIMEKGV